MSPPDKRVIDPMRASTGTMQLSASYNEPYDPSTSRHGRSSSQSTADIPYSNSYDPRLSRSRLDPVSSTYRSPDQSSTKLRTEYPIRPRQRSSTSAADGGHPPPLRVTVSPNVPNRASPIFTPGYGRSSSPWTADHGYLVPASPRHSHRRLYYTNDASRLARPRRRHGEYHAERSSRPRYPTVESLRQGDFGDWGSYSYTTQEQMEKDQMDRLDRGRGAYRHSRPLSLTGVEGHYVPSGLKHETRAHGPPPSQRGFDKLEGRNRRSTYDSDRELTGRPSYRAPVALHQDWDDGYYSSYRDSHYDDGHHDGRRHRRRRHHHHHHDSRDDDYRSSRGHNRTDSASGSVPGTGAGLGTAVLASGYESDWADYPYGYDYTRHHSRSRRPSRRHETDADPYTSEDDLRAYQREPSARRESPSDNGSQPLAIEAPRSHRTSRSQTRVPEGHHSSRRVSSSSQEDSKKPTESEPQIKGILKPPREKFPEDPNPVRPGVAPLKEEAHKKGIPLDARWTRIDRRLVNPEALEGKERFSITDEQPDCVFVLRVLTKEEIQAYAIRTHEIRCERARKYREYREERRRKKEERRRSGEEVSADSEDSENSDDSDDEDGDKEQHALPSSQQSQSDS